MTANESRVVTAHEISNTNGHDRIFYIIPMNTILDQNAKDIKEALDNYESILEHHSNVVIEYDKEGTRIQQNKETADSRNKSEDKYDEVDYKKSTERWDSDIILTSMVHFLDALFKNGNSDARRMRSLMNSVLIFDEIQALPKKCYVLFQKAILFLTEYCNCTVLLCTATQPKLELLEKSSVEIIGAYGDKIKNTDELYSKLERVEFNYDSSKKTYSEVADDIVGFEKKSVLTIVNTKFAASEIYQILKSKINDPNKNGKQYRLVQIEHGISDAELESRAKSCGKDEILCMYLTTFMCASHRKEIIRWMKAYLKEEKLVYCVSTSLIEAGINISFPVVVRSLAGIPNIIQAAGRCNRNFELKKYGLNGEVYIWKIDEQSQLAKLPDVSTGRDISQNLLDDLKKRNDLREINTTQIVSRYFNKEKGYTDDKKEYPYKKWNTNLVKMLSDNCDVEVNAKRPKGGAKPLDELHELFHQSFRTAGEAFNVIEGRTISILVPYGKGKELIQKLSDEHTLTDEKRYLKMIQPYSVNVYENMYNRLVNENALVPVGETGVISLREEYYDDYVGVKVEADELKFLCMDMV